MSWLTVGTFILATAAVAIITIVWVRRLKKSDDPTEEYFTGGRSLSWPVVAGSLLLTNLSTEQLVGLNGAVFKDSNMVGIAWETLAAFAMIVTALVFLPRYLASGFTTTPAFLERRFDKTTRSIVSGFFLLGYVSVLLPVVLYTGSLALQTMFDLDLPLWVIVAGIGTLGSCYAIIGGLKSVAISDTLNGIGLLIGGLAIPVLGLIALGEGSFLDGAAKLYEERPETLAVFGDDTKSVPWHTLLTGMMLIQVFYWSTNQTIVQRALGAKTLADGQKGVLFASLMKLVGPLMLCLPGIIALHLFTSGADCDPTEVAPKLCIAADDKAYPALVRLVLPDWSLGLFAAVLVGSILSSFNSALNSAATLFSLEFYQGYIKPDAAPEKIVRVGRNFGIGIAIASMLIAPLLAHAESIFHYLQKVNGLYSVPIIAMFLAGIATRWVSAAGAKAGMLAGLSAYTFFSFNEIEGFHWLHGYGVSFVLASLAMLVVSLLVPRSQAELARGDSADAAPVDMVPWRHARKAAVTIVVLAVCTYVGLTVLAA